MVDEADTPPTNATPDPTAIWVVQGASGGIPFEPILFDNRQDAERYFAESVVASDLEWTADCSGSWAGNDDDDVRMWGPIHLYGPLAPARKTGGYDRAKREFETRPFTPYEKGLVTRILKQVRGEA